MRENNHVHNYLKKRTKMVKTTKTLFIITDIFILT